MSAPKEFGECILQDNSILPSPLKNELGEELNGILTALKLAAKVVDREIKMAGAQRGREEDMSMFSHRRFLDALVNRGTVAGVATVFDGGDFISLPGCTEKELVLLIHPLDGTRQIDLNVSVGTLFSIYRKESDRGGNVELSDFLQCGNLQIAAGYVLYGSSTMLVLTCGNGVVGFTLDPSLGTFFLSHPNMRIPKGGGILSINGGKRLKFPRGVVEFVEYCQENSFSLRYIGSLVADFHRNLLKGGIFIYPPTFTDPVPSVSMVFQCFPLAFLVEQAGGSASDGFTGILDMQPTELTNRCPFFCGSADLVRIAEKFMARNKMYDGGWCFCSPTVPIASK